MALTPQQQNLKKLYETVCLAAKMSSKVHSCTQHVNAVLKIGAEGVPEIEDFKISDWYGGETLMSYTCGREH